MGFLSNITKSVGKLFNNATGATSAAKQSQEYALEAAKINNEYQKEFAKFAHQWEMEDLKKAGLNPILTATGGSGASASGGGVNSAQMQSSGVNPIDTLMNTINSIQTAKKTSTEIEGIQAGINNTDAQTALTNLDTAIKRKMAPSTVKLAEENVKVAIAEQAAKNAQTKLSGKQQAKIEEEIKKIKGGVVSETLGTDPVDTAKDLANKVGIKKTPNKGFGITFHSNHQ